MAKNNNKNVVKNAIKNKLKFNPCLIISVVLFLLLVGSILTRGFGLINYFAGGKDEITKKTIDFINKNFLSNGVTASLVSTTVDENGLYAIKFKIQEQEFTAYVTRDGKTIFPQAIPMTTQQTSDNNQNQQKEIPQKEKSLAQLFVMSYCPYGNQAESLMLSVIDLLKAKFDLELHYIVSKNGKNYESLHGKAELNQDVRELCVQKYERTKLWDFIKEINSGTTTDNIDAKWEGIAEKVGIDVDKIKECQTKESATLLDKEIELTKKYDVSGSPALLINGVLFSGSRTADGYKGGICSGFKTAPTECKTKLSTDTNNASSGDCQ
ncbi:MAG: hypothetical protein V1841_01755 [Patescibacteria group bacterium]